MNTSEAYQACHEVMLTSPGFVSRENASITYCIVQIAETDDSIHIQSSLINPALPTQGNLGVFLQRSQDQQVAIIGLNPASKAFQRAHQLLMAAMDTELSNEETVQQLRRLLFPITRKGRSKT